MTEFQYHKQLVDAEKRYDKMFDEEIEAVNELIGDAYTELEKAMALYLNSDILGDSMKYSEFKEYLISSIKDLL